LSPNELKAGFAFLERIFESPQVIQLLKDANATNDYVERVKIAKKMAALVKDPDYLKTIGISPGDMGSFRLTTRVFESPSSASENEKPIYSERLNLGPTSEGTTCASWGAGFCVSYGYP
jgi:hypothetical protein